MKLASLRAIPLEARFADIFGGEDKVPAEFSTPASHFRQIRRTGQMATLVLATSSDGHVGYGEAFGLPYAGAAASIVDGVIAPALTGADLAEPAKMLAALRHYFLSMGITRGAAIEALSGVDMALWDLKARIAGVPLASLRGGSPGAVPTYVSPIAFQDHPDKSASVARGYVDQGFTALKLKIGRGLHTDIEHVAAVRGAIGSSVPLYVDVNCGYDVRTAIEVANALAPYNIGWYEEPVPPDDPRALAEVRRNSPIPIAAGENEFTLEAHAALVAADAVDFLQPNIARAGGVSGVLAIGELCAKSGVGLALHGVGTCVAVSAALHTCRAAKGQPCYEANRLLNPLRDELGLYRLELRDGDLIAQDRPGHGGEPDMKRIAQYKLQPPNSPKEERRVNLGA